MEEVETFDDRISNSFLFALSTATGCTSLERDRYDRGETSNERRSTLVETSCRISRVYFCGDSLIAKNAKFYSHANFRLYGKNAKIAKSQNPQTFHTANIKAYMVRTYTRFPHVK